MIEISHDRQAHHAFKWEKYAGKDIIPCWVADTEFRCADPILTALGENLQHGVLGYTLPAQYLPANDAVVNWCRSRYDWSIDSDWLVWTPGVVPGFNAVCKAVCRAGDKVIIQTPNYPPLLAAPGIHDLQRALVPTLDTGEGWQLDFDELEKHAADPASRLLILCNPMNPVGEVFSLEQLQRVAKLCVDHDLILCSDEIHCDLILDAAKQHIPAGKLAALASRSVTLMAASKTFNIAGLGTSFAVIPDASLRRKFQRAMQGMMPWANIMGLVATQAAFEHGEPWRQAQLAYLKDNRDYLVAEINQIPGLRCYSAPATFLCWVDASGLGVDDVQQWAESRGVGPSPGRDFNAPHCFRINFGCSREMLEQIVARLKSE